MSEQFIPPVIAGMTSSNCLNWFLMFGIVLMKYIGLCLNPLMKPDYVAGGSHHAILHNTRKSFIYWSSSLNVFLLECFQPNNCTKMLLTLCSNLYVCIFKDRLSFLHHFFSSQLTTICFLQESNQI